MNTFNEGLERSAQDGTEYQFGAIQKDLAIIPVLERSKYLPEGVLQFSQLMDSQGCASRAPINALEAKFTYFLDHGMHPDLKRWMEKNGYIKNGRALFDDNYIEILSETTQSGNSLKAPLEAIRKHGLIPKTLSMDGLTWEEYMNPARVTPEMKKLGQEFLRRFTIGYEQVQSGQFMETLNEDFLDMAVFAWPEPVNNVYPKTEGVFNHAVAGVDSSILIFDNYLPFKKTLVKDYNIFPWAYSLSITSQNPYPDEQVALLEVLSRFGLLSFFAEAWKRLVNAEVADAVFTTQLPTEQPVEVTEPPVVLDPLKDPSTARHAIRVIGDEMGLSVKEKDLICAVIQAESGFKNTAKNENKNSAGKVLSTDHGLCQINDFYHIGAGKSFPSVQYVYDNPAEVVKWMIKQYKKGNLGWWIAYRSGAFQRYL